MTVDEVANGDQSLLAVQHFLPSFFADHYMNGRHVPVAEDAVDELLLFGCRPDLAALKIWLQIQIFAFYASHDGLNIRIRGQQFHLKLSIEPSFGGRERSNKPRIAEKSSSVTSS